MKDWLKKNMKLVLLIGTFISSAVAAAGVGFGITFRQAEPGEKPGVIIILPGESTAIDELKDDAFLGPKAFGAGEPRHPLFNLCARIAGNRYAAEHGLARSEGRQLAATVPYDQIVAQARAQGLDLKSVPTEYTFDGRTGVYKGKIIDWIIAHPEQVEMIIKIIIMLIPLFADADQAPGWPPFLDIRTVRGPPMPPRFVPVDWQMSC